MEKRPTVEEILDERTQRESHYNTLHDQQKEIDTYYELTYDANVPQIYREIKSNAAREWIDVGVRHFTLDNPKSQISYRGDSEAAHKKDAVIESFYDYWLNKIILQIKDAAKKLLLRGQVILKVGMDDTYFGLDLTGKSKAEIKEIEDRRLLYFPLTFDVVEPINSYPSPAMDGLVPEDVIVSYMMTVAEARKLCNRNRWPIVWDEGKKNTDTVKWTSYYDSNWRCFLIEDQPVLSPAVQPNMLHFCPYINIPSGWGQTNYEGKPEYYYRSILWDKRGMLKLQTRIYSQCDALVSRYAWERFKVKGPDEATIRQLFPNLQISMNPDDIIPETDQITIGVLRGDSPPPGIFQELAIISAQANPPQVLSGIRPLGIYSAQGLEDLVGTSKAIYKDVVKNLEDGLGIAMGMGARIIEKVYGHPVRFGGRIIKPRDIDGYYDCGVHLLAEPPEATDMRKHMGANLRKGESISLITELTKYHDMSIEQAENELIQILTEKALRQVISTEFITRDAIARQGMEQALEAIEETGKKASKFPPPRREPETIPTGYESTRKRGRRSPEMQVGPSPQEIAIRGEVIE